MKILHYSTSLSRSAGGLYASVSGLARAQHALGADVTVVGGADGFFETDRSIWGDVPLYPFELRHRYGLSREVFAYLRALKPDILHIHGVWSAGSIYGATAHVPVVVSPHGMLEPWILNRRPIAKAVHAALFERRMLGRAHVHALNIAEAESIRAFTAHTAERLFVLPNGIDPVTEISPAQPKTGVLYLGRLHEKKQVLQLVQAWTHLTEPPELSVAGWGDEQYATQAEAACADGPSVYFLGPLYGRDKSAAFAAARFFILPSLSEGMPMAVLEALQHGCIPILTDACNVPELFAAGIAERIAPDLSNLASVLERVGRLSEAELDARSKAAQGFSARYHWPEIASSMLARYAEILSKIR